MIINETEEKKIVFNTPLNFNVANSFPEFSSKDIPKIEFLINQINYKDNGRGYQVHIVKHAWSLCMNNGEITFILDKLVSLNIIKKTKDGNPGIDSNAYSVVKPYTNSNSNKSYYSVDDYLFLQKLKADKWVAMGKEHSAYIKPEPKPKVNKVKVTLNSKAEARIKLLEALLIENGIPVPSEPIIQLDEATPVVQLKPVSTPAVPIDKILHNFNDEDYSLDEFDAFFEATFDLREDSIAELLRLMPINYRVKPIGHVVIEVDGVGYRFFNNATVKIIVFEGIELMQVA
ncbi:hypothetical protein BDD43_2815 [Mucilaginibacter gracilis]|uniref:Uncharacterized protein n=1 Tax=Mucilaginibacter gracilis TaxID=423350 RepID=A0A495J0Z1_9SPHI|nr:hypothetical protein [Mucilaginibacter gracilis]RKR82630.1 hypothetical protein BDD43_2815 [Mucilaginibacter gracilis]